MKNSLTERIRWWIYHPKYELICLLGGIPKQHINTTHYRNIENIVSTLKAVHEQILKEE